MMIENGNMATRLLTVAILLVLTATARGQFDPAFDDAAPRYGDSRDVVTVEVIPERVRVAPGDQVRVAIVLDHQQGWHSHTNDPDVPPELGSADDYIATQIFVEVPEGSPLEAFPKLIGWPKRHVTEVGWFGTPVEYEVFDGRAVAYLAVRVTGDAPLGPARMIVRPVFQSCDENSCMQPTPGPPAATLTGSALSDAQAEWDAYGIEVELEVVALDDAQSRGDVDAALFADFPETVWDDIAAGVDYVDFDLFGIITFKLDAGSTLGLILLLLVAAIGGFILNLTPCVLPVIPIKIMGLSRSAAGSRGRTLALGVAMAAGVIGFWLLIGILIATVSGFTATNQLFQYPLFTIGVGVFIAIMAIGMCGLFAIRLPQFVYAFNPKHETLIGSFGFGVMAAVLSTPCTAPFMGAAAAWAATQSPVVTLTTFSSIGVGMAFPYVVLAAFPMLVAKMPKTGPASELIKQVMGLLMLAAAAFFIGVGLSGSLVSPPDPPTRAYWWVVAGLVAAAGLWLAWRTFRITGRMVPRAIFGTLAAVTVAVALFMAVRLTDRGPIDWTYYTPERFAQAKASGNVVVMEFTAEWCLNCKALEESVLRSERVTSLLNGKGVVPIKVDLTGNNAEGRRMHEAADWVGIPLLIVFSPDGEAVFKHDFYTVEQVVDAVRRAGGAAVAAR